MGISDLFGTLNEYLKRLVPANRKDVDVEVIGDSGEVPFVHKGHCSEGEKKGEDDNIVDDEIFYSCDEDDAEALDSLFCSGEDDCEEYSHPAKCKPLQSGQVIDDIDRMFKANLTALVQGRFARVAKSMERLVQRMSVGNASGIVAELNDWKQHNEAVLAVYIEKLPSIDGIVGCLESEDLLKLVENPKHCLTLGFVNDMKGDEELVKAIQEIANNELSVRLVALKK